MTREQIIKNLEYLIQFLPGKSIYAGETLTCAIAALRDPQPDPDTGLVPCGWCGPERMGWFSVQFWVRASTGKRKWMSVTQKYKKQVNYCPMCGRKLTAPSRPGAIGPEAGERTGGCGR